MTPDETAILREHGEALASINTNLELLRKDLNGRIPKLEAASSEHDKQISYWKGAIAVVAFFLLLLGGAETWFHAFEHAPSAPHTQR